MPPSAAYPRPQLPENGTILVPIADDTGGWSMSHVDTGEEDCAYWLGGSSLPWSRGPVPNPRAPLGGAVLSAAWQHRLIAQRS